MKELYLNMKKDRFKKASFIFALLMIGCLSSTADASAYSSNEKRPNVYSVLQQQGPTCPFIPWVNLKLIKDIRENNDGKINLENAPFFTKLQSYARFLPQIVTYDRAMDTLRQNEDGAYSLYETQLRNQGIHENARFSSKGKPIDEIDSFFSPLDKARRLDYTPYNIKHVPDGFSLRWLPIIHDPEDGDIYFYDYKENEKQKLSVTDKYSSQTKYLCKTKDYVVVGNPVIYHFTEEQIGLMGFNPDQFEKLEIQYGQSLMGSQTGYYLFNSTSDEYCQKIFYDVGSYQHLLFALGLDKNNKSFDDSSVHYQAHQEFKQTMDANPLNPLANIRKEDFFEYHLANIFLQNADLKEAAKVVLSKSCNKTWKFYEKSSQYYDSHDSSSGTQFKDKQDFLPGEEQMLAYFFSKEMRLLWSASIGDDAVMATTELDQDLGSTTLSIIKLFVNSKTLLKDAQKKRTIPNVGKRSLLGVWGEIVSKFETIQENELNGQIDFVTFSGHGCVVSFDSKLINMQTFQDKKTAKKIGFTQWEQLYDKALNPFYRFKEQSEPLPNLSKKEEEEILE